MKVRTCLSTQPCNVLAAHEAYAQVCIRWLSLASKCILHCKKQANIVDLQGRDHTLYALTEGHVTFRYNKLNKRRSIDVVALEAD